MLSLGSNISATQAVEAKYSINFDGTDDFIDCGSSTDVAANGQSELSVMFWIKTTASEGNKYVSSIKRSSASSAFSVTLTSGGKIKAFIAKKMDDTGGHNSPESTTSVNDGNWHHVVITGKASSQKVYVNGGVHESETTGEFALNTSADSFTIGDHAGSQHAEINLSELAVFNTELDQNNIQAVYNGGGDFNLTFNQGNYDSSSNLTAYYKMGDGFFDDKANGIVHDQDNPGFGSNLVTGNNSTFDGANDWTAYNPSGTTGISTTGGVLQVTLSGAGNTVDSGAKLEVTSSLTAGKVYKVRADIWLGTETETSGWKIHLGGVDSPITLSSSQTTFIKYITISDTSDLLIYNTDVDSSTGTFFIDNVSIEQLNGNPGMMSDADSSGFNFTSDTP